MSDHLPVCQVEQCCSRDERATMHLCICPELRACEARVREEEQETAHRIFGYRNGYAAALDAAREAVYALPARRVPYWNSNDGACIDVVSLLGAVAAIDALREGKR